jgi:hypothetical protein
LPWFLFLWHLFIWLFMIPIGGIEDNHNGDYCWTQLTSLIPMCFGINNGRPKASSLLEGLSFPLTLILKVKGLHSLSRSESVYKEIFLVSERRSQPVMLFVRHKIVLIIRCFSRFSLSTYVEVRSPRSKNWLDL